MGRPSKYQEDFPERLIAYFSVEKTQKQVIGRVTRYNKDGQATSEEEKYKVVPNDMPTFAGFARSIGVSDQTLENWYNEMEDTESEHPVRKYPEFFAAYNTARQLQKEFLIDNALQGNSPPASFIFVAKNVTDMTDKQIIETKDSDLEAKRDAIDDFLDSLRDDSESGSGEEGQA